MIYKFFIFTILINFNLLLSIYSLSPSGENVCSREIETMTSEEYEKERRNCQYSYRSDTCLRELNQRNKKSELVCCDGYYEKDDKCKLLCPQGCVHGDCVFDLCTNCALGFGGINCNQTCPNGRFGLNCDNDCNCILDSNCNKNYKFCLCNSNSIKNECNEICKCRKKSCDPGHIGKNCDMKCPDYKYGSLCLNDCLCNKNGTEICSNETGECKCSDHYYGIHCEKYCAGNLKCSSHTNCTCEKTNNDLIDEIEKNKNYLEQEIDRIRISKNFIAFFLSCIVILLFLVILRIRIRTKKIKHELRSISIRYSNNGKDQFNNPIYSANLETDFSNLNSKDNLEKLIEERKINFFEKINSLKRNLFKNKEQNQSENNYPNLISENSEIYSTINENKKTDEEVNEDEINN